MPAAPIVRVEGAKELRATMKKAGTDLADLKATHAKIAGLIAGGAGPRAPVRSGRLAGSVRGSGAATVATVRAGGASVPYANAIHWGWKAHGIAANPFIANVAHETEPIWTRYSLISVNAILAKVKGI